VAGRTVTSWPSLRTDITNAGGTWVDQVVAVDGKLVTSRNPGDLPEFNRTFIEMLERHGQADLDPEPQGTRVPVS
jgi:protease I